MQWPEGKRFAFTVFDDPDSQTLEASQVVYGFLRSLGMRTTKAVWPMGPYREGKSTSETCDNPAYREHVRQLHAEGFEVGFHGASIRSSLRNETEAGLERFREYFGGYPSAMANHFDNTEAIYWGAARMTGFRRWMYTAATLNRRAGQYSGEVEGSPYFWGDLCHSRIRYCRNFVFSKINTLQVCPEMPYHDPQRPFVHRWYASAEGADAGKFVGTIAEAQQEALEEEGGACIMYTHFGKGFVEGNRLLPRFENLMKRLGSRNGWFVPVSTLLDYLEQRRGEHVLSSQERARLEWRWLAEKLVRRTA